jgi:hypothetical protein
MTRDIGYPSSKHKLDKGEKSDLQPANLIFITPDFRTILTLLCGLYPERDIGISDIPILPTLPKSVCQAANVI